jgi:serine/threonine protein kinase
MEDYIRARGRFPDDTARYYLHQLVDALEYMHSHKIFHRDMKPANILMSDAFDIKLTDFGLSKKMDSSVTQTEFAGTPCYMAPEIWM